jgi:hypothetical protein
VLLFDAHDPNCANGATFGVWDENFLQGATKLSGLGLQKLHHLRPIGRDEGASKYVEQFHH